LKKLLITILFFIISTICFSIDSTGLSSVTSKIIPISVNNKGEILCKTRFTKNEMGGSMSTIVEYGFCILSNDSIKEIKTKIINPFKLNMDDYDEQVKFWDAIFETKTTQNQLNTINKEILKNDYNFLTNNTDSYKVDSKITISNFEKEKNISLKKRKQKGLHNAESTKYHSNKRLHILYDFGNVIILNNVFIIDDDQIMNFGATFNYLISYNDSKIEFESYFVTGVLTIK